MQSGVGWILESVKLQLIQFSLTILKKITLKLLYLKATYEANDYAEKNEKFDLRKIPQRIKSVLLHDSNIIDKRWAECLGCEHFIKATGSCKKCGCFMKIKTRIASASCPDNPPKWSRA